MIEISSGPQGVSVLVEDGVADSELSRLNRLISASGLAFVRTARCDVCGGAGFIRWSNSWDDHQKRCDGCAGTGTAYWRIKDAEAQKVDWDGQPKKKEE